MPPIPSGIGDWPFTWDLMSAFFNFTKRIVLDGKHVQFLVVLAFDNSRVSLARVHFHQHAFETGRNLLVGK